MTGRHTSSPAKMADLTDNEILVGLLRLTAMTGDWHTQIISSNMSRLCFPMRIEATADGLFITAAATLRRHSRG